MPDVKDYSREWYIGEEAMELKGIMNLQFPIEHGVVEDWPAMERIYHYTFYTDLRIDPSEFPILLTEAPLNPRTNREQMPHKQFYLFMLLVELLDV